MLTSARCGVSTELTFIHLSNVVDTSASPAGTGSCSGDGSYEIGALSTVAATPEPGFSFACWTDDGTVVSQAPRYQFTVDINRSLVAHFVVTGPQMGFAHAAGGALMMEWARNPPGWMLQESADLSPGSWIPSTRPIDDTGVNHGVRITPAPGGCSFFRLVAP